MKTANGYQIIEVFESWCPKSLAYEGDPVGMQIGTLRNQVDRVLVTLDVTPEVVQEAIDKDCQLIIAHHPPLFRPMKTIQTDTFTGQIVEMCLKNDISIYAAHTNLDVVSGGVNDLLSEALELQDMKMIEQSSSEKLMKLAVFVPVADAQNIRDALAKAGAGKIGDYSSCSYSTLGTGRFRPESGATPTIGQIGTIEEVQEEKIEVVFPESLKTKIIKAMFRHHPYEEPAYDLLLLEQEAEQYGIGRVGYLKHPMTLNDFSHYVKEKLGVPFVRQVGSDKKEIQKVAVLGGDGNKYIYKAKRAGADVLVTGDLYFHVAQDALAIDLAVVDPGHHIESIMKVGVVKEMTSRLKEKQFSSELIASEISTEPFQLK